MIAAWLVGLQYWPVNLSVSQLVHYLIYSTSQ